VLLDFHKTAFALVDSILHEQCGLALNSRQANSVTSFVLAQHSRLVDYLRFPLRAITLAFDAGAILRHGKPFHALPHEARRLQIERWKHGIAGPQRDLILFYERLAVFGFHSLETGGQNAG
jgi:hypothetical protein